MFTVYHAGLSEVVQPFVPRFVEVGIDGARLLSLTHSDLAEFGIDKLGHQELILEAIDLLIQLVWHVELLCVSVLIQK